MTALRETMAELIGLEEANARLAGMITALDVRYGVGGDGSGCACPTPTSRPKA